MENNNQTNTNKKSNPAILIILVIVIIAIVGYGVWQSSSKKDRKQDETTTVSTTTETTAPTTESTTQATTTTTTTTSTNKLKPSSSNQAIQPELIPINEDAIYLMCEYNTVAYDENDKRRVDFHYYKGLPCIEWVCNDYPEDSHMLSYDRADKYFEYFYDYQADTTYALSYTSEAGFTIYRYDTETKEYFDEKSEKNLSFVPTGKYYEDYSE